MKMASIRFLLKVVAEMKVELNQLIDKYDEQDAK